VGGYKRPAPTHRARRGPQPLPPTVTGFSSRPSTPRRPVPSVSVKQPPLQLTPRDPSEARTQIDPKQSGVTSKPRPTTQVPDNTSAKLLVIASMMSLVVVVLSLAVLSKTTGGSSPVMIETTAPVRIETISTNVASQTPQEQPPEKADLMLSLDVEPKNASLVVNQTREGFEVKVAANGYQPETRKIEKGVKGQIAVKLEPAPKRALKKKAAKKKAAKKRLVAKKASRPDAEVFLTGSDL
jgi:hypothetical protein